MVWSNLNELEYYHPNPQWGCYGEPVFAPQDIFMQASAFAGSATVVGSIAVCDPAGAILEDATAFFNTYLGSFILAGETYYFYNIKCNDFSPAMLSNRCFTLRLILTDGGVTVFDMYTQKYDLKTTAVYAGGVSADGVELDNCVPGAIDNTCAFNYVKFRTTFECIDTFTGEYYGTGTAISGTPYAYERVFWIEGRLRQLQSDVQRTINIKGRVQRTQRIKKFVVTEDSAGGIPVWKMDEIEQALLANHIYIADGEYQYTSGAIFEQYGQPKGCEYRYKMTLNIEQPVTWQIFGCVPTCEDLATYYHFPRSFERVYDDAMRMIAGTPEELVIYLSALPGAKPAQDLPFALPCPTFALIRAQSTGALPQYFYVDSVIPSARVFPKRLPVTTLNFTPLCNGIQNAGYPPQLGEPLNEATPNYPPDIGVIFSESENSYILAISADPDWLLNVNYSSSMNLEGEVVLNIDVKQTTPTTVWTNEPIAIISGDGRPNQDVVIYATDNPNLPVGSMVRITSTNGEIQYSGGSFDNAGTQEIQFFMLRYNINN